MKRDRCVAGVLMLCAILTAPLRADPTTPADDPDLNSPAATGSAEDPETAALHYRKQPTPSEIEARKKAQDARDSDRDWLVRAYEQQLQKRANAQNDRTQNLYYQLSSNKELAKLAGLPYLDSSADGAQPSSLVRTGATGPGRASLSLRADGTSPAGGDSSRSSMGHFKPLISSDWLTGSSGLPNFYGAPPPVRATPPPVTRSSSPSRNRDLPDDVALDTPGLTAAKSSVLDKASSSLSFNLPESESLDELGPHPENFSKMELNSNAETLRKRDAIALGLDPTKPAPASLVNGTPPVKVPDEEKPIRVTNPTPSHQQIADPRDIFYH